MSRMCGYVGAKYPALIRGHSHACFMSAAHPTHVFPLL